MSSITLRANRHPAPWAFIFMTPMANNKWMDPNAAKVVRHAEC
jgi:hypothetical protein